MKVKGTVINMDQCLLVRLLLEEEMVRTNDIGRFNECTELRNYIRSSLGEMEVSWIDKE